MRPLNHSNVHPSLSLDALATDLSAGVVLVLATLPGGDLRLVRASSGGSPSLARGYAAEGQLYDAPTWSAILNETAVDGDAFFSGHSALRQAFRDRWLTVTGRSHAMVAPLVSPLLRGYPGALVALGDQAFSDTQLDQLSEAAEQVGSDPAYSAPMRLADRAKPSSRFFAIDESGTFIGTSPAEADLDATLAEHLVAFAKQRVARATPATGGERVLLTDASGEAHAFTIAMHAKHPGLAHAGKDAASRMLVLCRVPNFAEWLELRPADFGADQEIGRLLPAFKFMREHFHEGVTLPKIAAHVHLSPFHFHRRFTELLGITPKHFLYDCQIAKAQDMLLAGSHELEDIAKLCGFAHQSHFTSRFKQATGLTPTRWRRLKHTTGQGSSKLTPSRV